MVTPLLVLSLTYPLLLVMSHSILLDKLEIYGNRGKCLDLLGSYLTNRTQNIYDSCYAENCKGQVLMYVSDLP